MVHSLLDIEWLAQKTRRKTAFGTKDKLSARDKKTTGDNTSLPYKGTYLLRQCFQRKKSIVLQCPPYRDSATIVRTSCTEKCCTHDNPTLHQICTRILSERNRPKKRFQRATLSYEWQIKIETFIRLQRMPHANHSKRINRYGTI